VCICIIIHIYITVNNIYIILYMCFCLQRGYNRQENVSRSRGKATGAASPSNNGQNWFWNMNLWVEVVSFSGYIYLFRVYCFIYIVCLPDHTVKRMMILWGSCNSMDCCATKMWDFSQQTWWNQKTWRKNPKFFGSDSISLKLGLGQIQDLPPVWKLC